MNRCTGAVVHHRVVLILALVCVALLAGAALFLAVKVARTEIPAARALHDVPSDRSHVANLRGGRVTRSICQGGIAAANLRMIGNLRQRDKRLQMESILS